MSDESNFSFESRSSGSASSSGVTSSRAKTGRIIKLFTGDDFDYADVSLVASPRDTLPLPLFDVSPENSLTEMKNSANKPKKLMTPKANVTKVYDIKELFSPKSQMTWKTSLSPEVSLRKSPGKAVSAYADHLFSKKSATVKKIEFLRHVKEEEEKAKCTFTPNITRQDDTKRGFGELLKEMEKKVQRRDENVNQLKVSLESVDKQISDTNFKPQICKKSAQLAAKRSMPAFEGLHSAAKSALKRSIDQHLKSTDKSSALNRPFIPTVNKVPIKAIRTESKTPTTKKLLQRSNSRDSCKVPKRDTRATDIVLTEKLTREFNEAFRQLTEQSNMANYLTVRAILQKLQFLILNPGEAQEQHEREQLIGFWHELDTDKVGEVEKDKVLNLLLKVVDPRSKAARTYTLLHNNRREAKRCKSNAPDQNLMSFTRTVRHQSKQLGAKLIEEANDRKEMKLKLQKAKETAELQSLTFRPKVLPVRSNAKAGDTVVPRTEHLYQMAKKQRLDRSKKAMDHLTQIEQADQEANLGVPDLTLSNRIVLMSTIPVAGEEKAVKRLREAQKAQELKKTFIEKGHTNVKQKSLSPAKPKSEYERDARTSSPSRINLQSLVSYAHPNPTDFSKTTSVLLQAHMPLTSSKHNKPRPGLPTQISDVEVDLVKVKLPPSTAVDSAIQALNELMQFSSSTPQTSKLDIFSTKQAAIDSSKVTLKDEPILNITVNQTLEQSEQLVPYSETDLENTVESFANKHKLSESKRGVQTQMVKDYIEDCNSPLEAIESLKCRILLDDNEGVSGMNQWKDEVTVHQGFEVL